MKFSFGMFLFAKLYYCFCQENRSLLGIEFGDASATVSVTFEFLMTILNFTNLALRRLNSIKLHRASVEDVQQLEMYYRFVTLCTENSC